MGVKALANAGLTGNERFSHGEILRPGQFHQSRFARDDQDPAARALDHSGLVSGRLVFRPGRKGIDNDLIAEGLGGLGAPQVCPIH